MTDSEIIQGLIDRDNRITRQFFFVKCRPLLSSIMRSVYDYPVDFDEMVNNLYEYLLADDAVKLKSFEGRSSIYQWIKVVAIRFFLRNRNQVIDSAPQDVLCINEEEIPSVDTAAIVADKIDVARMLDQMTHRRYAEVLRRLILEDADPVEYAAELGVTVDNLYNIKRRAIFALARQATKTNYYGR